jgi:hypothetical protein
MAQRRVANVVDAGPRITGLEGGVDLWTAQLRMA